MIAIGLMSGTSCDGVDVAIIKTDGHIVQEFISEYHLPYPNEFQVALSNVINTGANWLELENQLTHYHAQAVFELIDKTASKLPQIIGFHGQTVYHAPDKGICWQIGNPHLLAKLTGIDVVSDFRRRDVYNGGQGAPLVPIFHKALMNNHKLPVAIVNIGGVANITYIGKENLLFGYDVGPGSALINDTMIQYFKKQYDNEGQIAKSGRVDKTIVKQLMEDSFFKKLPPKSLDRNYFKEIVKILENHRSADIISTLTAFTVEAIAYGISMEFLNKTKAEVPEFLYICGGGGKNITLIEMLQDKLSQVKILPMEALGFKSDYIEAQAFAYLAVRFLKNLPSTFPSTTGTSQAVISGVNFQA